MELEANISNPSETSISFNGVSPYFCDFNATTPIPDGLKQLLHEAFENHWLNFSAPYLSAANESSWLRLLRHRLGSLMGEKEITTVFCGSATEALNQAIYSLSQSLGEGALLITTDIEHSAVNEAASRWFSSQVRMVRAKDLIRGDFEELAKFAKERNDVCFVLQAANNETGAILPVQAIRSQFPNLKIFLDASQIFGKYTDFLDVLSEADGAVISPHKFYGPKGIGILNWSSRLGEIQPLIVGGGQEHGLRSGTENSPILYLTLRWLEQLPALIKEHAAISTFASRFESLVLEEMNGAFAVSASPRLSNTMTICFPGIISESAVAALDSVGIMASTGSACKAGTREPSKTYLAFGLTWEDARSVVRFSFGIPNLATSPETMAEKVIATLKRIKS